MMSVDTQAMLLVIENFSVQCQEALYLTKGITASKINNVVVCGMGGSGIAGDVLGACCFHANIPITVVKGYELPSFVNAHTLVFAVSYSGNTQETLQAYADAVKKNAQIIAITSGGTLAEICPKKILVPDGLQPRAALGYLFFPMLGVLANAKIVSFSESEIKEMLSLLAKPDDFKHAGKSLAQKIGEKIPLIYSSAALGVCGYRWKCQFNENSKSMAFANVLSEMNHNEIVGFQTIGREQFIAIFLRDAGESDEMKKRFDATKKIVSTKIETQEVYSKGHSLLARLFSLIYLGDFTSYYLALHKNIDPTPIPVIEHLKKELAK